MSLTASLAPAWTELVPWTDKRGRFHPLRAATFAILLAPAIWLMVQWAADMLGPRAVNAAIHSTGYYAVWILLASLLVSPAKALAGLPNLVVVRRMIGNAAMVYAGIHLLLYATDQNWRLLTIASEVVSRFYLTIGFVGLTGLVALGATSTDGWARALGRNWKRLHRLVYAITVLALVHYVLQSKLDVSQALLAAGAFTWLMLWRLLPAGRDRSWPPLLGISVAAGVLTLVYEYGWYRFGTRIDPWKVVSSELDIAFGLRPAGRVFALGLFVTGLAELRRMAQTRTGQSLGLTMGVFALGGLVDDVAAFVMGWDLSEATPAGVTIGGMDLVWMVLLGLLGAARWKLRGQWHRHLVDAIWVACLVQHVAAVGFGNRELAAVFAGLIVTGVVILGGYLWKVSHGAALTLVPLALLLAYEVATLW